MLTEGMGCTSKMGDGAGTKRLDFFIGFWFGKTI
jgi:hypothetical protein